MPIKELWSMYINSHVYKNLRRQLTKYMTLISRLQ